MADLVPQTHSQPWAMGRAQYVVVVVNPPAHVSGRNVFDGRGGTRYESLMANTRQEAERIARGKDIVVLEVVPLWSFPARD